MLTQDEINGLLQTFDKTIGCPLTVADRLSAFSHGAVAMMKLLSSCVTLDAVKSGQSMKAKENTNGKAKKETAHSIAE